MRTFFLIIFTSALIVNLNYGQDTVKKAKARMSIEYFKTSAKEYLKVQVKSKIDKKYQPVKDIEISIFINRATHDTLIGKVNTDGNGTAILKVPLEYSPYSNVDSEFTYIAVIEKNQKYNEKSVELKINEVEFNADFIENETDNLIQVTVSKYDSLGISNPVEDINVHFYVERPLGQLPIGSEDNITDENGITTIIFPNDLPSDVEGNTTIFIKIEDDENYGNIELEKTLKWGTPTVVDNITLKRSLWASGANAPILLLLLVNAMIIAIWGILIYIVYKIFVISRI